MRCSFHKGILTAGFITILLPLCARQDPDLSLADTSYFRPGEDNRNLLEAISRNHPGNVFFLLKRGADPNTRSEEGVPALMYAIDSSRILTLKLLLLNGAHPDSSSSDHTTPLMLAVFNHQFEAAHLLLEKGADPDLKDDYKAGALHYAAALNDYRIADLLLFYDADRNIRDKDGNDPLMTAVYFNSIETADVLLQNGIGPDTRDDEGNTPLMVAAQQGNPDLVRLLLEYGAEINSANEKNYTPLAFAVQSGQKELAALLIEKGADTNHQVTANRNLYEMAKQSGQTEIRKLLAAEGASRLHRPDFSELALGWGNSFADHEFMMQVRGSLIDRRYGFFAETGIDWRPALQKVQVRENDTLVFQYREMRTGWSHGVGKTLSVRPPNSMMELGLYAAVHGLMTFPRYKGLNDHPPVQYNIVPSGGAFIRWGVFGIKAGVERYTFKTLYEKPWKFNITLFVRYVYNSPKQEYKEIYY